MTCAFSCSPLAQVLVELLMRVVVPIDVHRHEGGELHEAGIDHAARAWVLPRDARDEIALEPAHGLAGGELVDLGRVDARIDGSRHQRHAARLRSVAVGRHHGDGGQRLHARLANSHEVRARTQLLQEFDEVVDIVVKAEGTGLQAHVARIVPIGDVDVIIGQQRAYGIAQERREVARQRRHDEDARLLDVDVLLEAQ